MERVFAHRDAGFRGAGLERLRGAIRWRRVGWLAAGRFTASPFPEEVLEEARKQWFSALGNEQEMCRKAEGQPFYLAALSASLRRIGDPDWKVFGCTAKTNYQHGVPVGDESTVLPRTPA
eukprot:6486265-Amphidinium_carterae.1